MRLKCLEGMDLCIFLSASTVCTPRKCQVASAIAIAVAVAVADLQA